MIEILTLVLLVSLIIFLVVFLIIQSQKKAIPQDQSDLKVYMQKEYEGLKTQLRALIYESNEKNTKDLYNCMPVCKRVTLYTIFASFFLSSFL